MEGFKLEGLEELQEAVKELKELVGPKHAHGLVKDAAEMMENEVRTRVPVGPTENLKRAVVLRKMDNPGTWVVAIDRMIAPHAHLVEYGHAGGAGPHPFFRPAVDTASSKAMKMIEDEIGKAIKG